MSFAEGLIQRESTIESARAEIVREAARLMPLIDNRRPAARTDAGPEDMARAAGEALCTRVDPSHEVPEMGRPFAGRRLPDIARELLRLRGLNTLGSDAEVITRSLHTTSDLASVVGVFANKVLAQRYQAVPGGVKRVCKRGTSHSDFRGRNVIRLGELPQLEKVNEKGEFKRGGLLDSRESYAVATYGKVFGMSRQLLINDDLGALADIASGWGLAAAEFENSHLTDVLTANSGGGPKLGDGQNLFHATHGNLASTGADPAITYLSDARLALRRMKGLSGTTPVNVEPRFILVPAALETKTEGILAEIYPAQAEDVNVFGKRFELIVDPRLDAKSEKAWYLFADPAIVPVIEYAYLSGFEGVQIETRNGFDVDGIEVRARLDFGAGGVDFRGAFRNPGLA